MFDDVACRAVVTAMRGAAILSVVFLLIGCGDNGAAGPGEDEGGSFLRIALSGAVNAETNGSQKSGAIGIYDPGPRSVVLVSGVGATAFKVSFTLHGMSERDVGSFAGEVAIVEGLGDASWRASPCYMEVAAQELDFESGGDRMYWLRATGSCSEQARPASGTAVDPVNFSDFEFRLRLGWTGG